MLNNPNECKFDVDGIVLSGLRWGEGNRIKVIALHGWLDNAASFSLLAPFLENIDLVALDMAGHGRSGFRLGESPYNIWQDLREIAQVKKQLGWSNCAFIGHSRGAMVATLYSGSLPESVTGICLIDAITPAITSAADLPKQLGDSVRTVLANYNRRSTYYEHYEDAAIVRMHGTYPLTEKASRLLAERSVAQEPNQGFYWRYDKCLLTDSEIRLTETQAKAFVDSFPVCAKVIVAEGGLVHSHWLPWYDNHRNLDIVSIVGEHHLQLSRDPDTIKLLASTINDYFSTL